MGFPTSDAPPYTPPAAMYGVSDEVSGRNGGEMSSYEQTREERIRKNLERMKELGIHDLSLTLKSMSNKPAPRSTPSARRTPQHFTAPTPPGPRRRSSRLQNATPVVYTELPLKRKDDCREDDHGLLMEDGSRPEFYTEEHEKFLGSTEMSWTLFVDGYGKDGRRIYDPVNGKTCHQCRQKTLGHRTHCCKCNKVQGQFCGDCLYMRYGEHVLEANQNPNWICPVCRGICNCSLCRQAKGWAPTGTLYKKITKLGFKSVAHYIIQTRQKGSDSDTTPGSKVPTSAKRSLPFSNTDEKPHSVDADYKLYLEETSNPLMQSTVVTDGNTVDSGPWSNDRSNVPSENATDVPTTECELGLLKGIPTIECETQAQKLDDKEDEGGTCLKSDCFAAASSESSPEAEGAKYESQDVEQQKLTNIEATLNCLNNATSDVKPAAAADAIQTPSSADATTTCPGIATPVAAATNGSTRKLRSRGGGKGDQDEDPEAPTKDIGSTEPAVAEAMTCMKSNRKRIHVSEPSPSSIAARLRQRRAAGRVRVA